jgi:hypothetical protein
VGVLKKTGVLFFAGLILFLTGCAMKSYEKPRPAMIVIKTPTLRYADQGFVYRGKERVKVQVYVSGKAAFTLRVGKRICVDHGCMAEKRFYEKYLHADYPEGTLAAVFLKKPIFGGREMTCEGERCEQRIEEPGRYDIIYAFDSGRVKFKDRLNHILIKITEL